MHLVQFSVLAVAHKDLAGSVGVALDPAGEAVLHRLIMHEPPMQFRPESPGEPTASGSGHRPDYQRSTRPSTPVPRRQYLGS